MTTVSDDDGNKYHMTIKNCKYIFFKLSFVYIIKVVNSEDWERKKNFKP